MYELPVFYPQGHLLEHPVPTNLCAKFQQLLNHNTHYGYQCVFG